MIETLGTLPANAWLGLTVAFSGSNLAYCAVGVLVGTIIGVIPGIGTIAAISMLFPITFHLDPTAALIMLAGIWYGATFGGSTAAILLNIPGTPTTAITCLDGYPMAQQGRGGVALLMTTVASFVGGSFGILMIMLFAPILAAYARSFGATEYFALMLLGLVGSSLVTEGRAAKNLAMVVLGVGFGTVGQDLYTGSQRFTFGLPSLYDGISLVAFTMGIFGISEIIVSIRNVQKRPIGRDSVTLRAMKPRREDVRRSWGPMARGSSIGFLFGILPGTGSAIAAFVSYAAEKYFSRPREGFGRGAIEGIMAPEAANSAADQAAFIPTLSLGVPGSPAMAVMLGILIIHGVAPGPQMLTQNADLFWGLVMSFWIGSLLLLILNIPLIGIWVRLLLVPYHLLYPSILMFICLGVYTTSQSATDVWITLVFGLIGYSMRLLNFAAAPLLLGFVLGPLMEEHFRRAMLISHGDLMTFVDRPISAVILAFTGVLLLWMLVTNARRAPTVRTSG